MSAVPALAATDPYLERQWGMLRVGAQKAWSTAKGDGITIAIVDTGVDLRHEDLVGKFVPGYDFVDRDAKPQDENGHGTHVAGIAAAKTGNGIGVSGVAPAAKIMPIRVLNAEGRGFTDDIEEGMRWAVDHGADVINLSLGGAVIDFLEGGTVTRGVDYAWSKGVITVTAAGNESFFRTEFDDADTLIVTATNPSDEKPGYATNVGFAKWGLAAPGGTNDGGKENSIFSTYWSAGDNRVHYGWGIGTSMAAPHVAGAAALLRGLGLGPQETVDRLLSTAKDIGDSGEDFEFGHGRLNAAGAVAGLGSGGPKPAPRTPTPATRAPTTPSDDAPPAAAAPVATPDDPADKPPPRKSSAQEAPDEVPDERIIASREPGGRSNVPNFIVGGALLATALGLVAYTRLRASREAS